MLAVLTAIVLSCGLLQQSPTQPFDSTQGRISRDSWEVQVILEMSLEGIIASPFGLIYRDDGRMSRYGLAAATYAASRRFISFLHSVGPSLRNAQYDGERELRRRGFRDVADRWSTFPHKMMRIVDMYEREFIAIGCDVDELRGTLEWAQWRMSWIDYLPDPTEQFSDVPKNHWAYDAVHNLKREGILVGYPDGVFSPKSERLGSESKTY